MIRVYVVCEGQTEEKFIGDVISPILAQRNIFLIARTIQTSKGFSGGALSYDRVRSFIVKCLKSDSNALVTTFFDLYGLPNNFPYYSEAHQLTDLYEKVEYLELSLKNDITSENSSFSSRLIPYIQPHEFEGLLFSDIRKLTDLEPSWGIRIKKLQPILDNFDSPEHINNGYETKPSQQLKNTLSNPAYIKTLHGPLAAASIGVDKLCSECKHFASWYQQLVQLGTV